MLTVAVQVISFSVPPGTAMSGRRLTFVPFLVKQGRLPCVFYCLVCLEVKVVLFPLAT